MNVWLTDEQVNELNDAVVLASMCDMVLPFDGITVVECFYKQNSMPSLVGGKRGYFVRKLFSPRIKRHYNSYSSNCGCILLIGNLTVGGFSELLKKGGNCPYVDHRVKAVAFHIVESQ